MAEASKLAVTSLLLRETYTSVVLCRDLHMFTGGGCESYRIFFSNAGELHGMSYILGHFDGICEQFLGGAWTTIGKVDIGSRQLHGHGAACPRIVGNSAAACGEALYFWM